MRLKTKLVVVITGLVLVIVTSISAIYLTQLLHHHIEQSYTDNDVVAHEILFATRDAIETNLPALSADPNDPAAWRAAVAAALNQNRNLQLLLNSVVRYSPAVYDVSIGDWNNRGLISTNPEAIDSTLPARPEYSELRDAGLTSLIRSLFRTTQVYDITLPLERNDRPFLTVRVGIRTTFLRNAVSPWLYTALSLMGLAILTSLLVSAFVGNLALQPIEQINERLDAFQAGAESAGELEFGSNDAVVRVSHKIERLGRRMRNVEEVFSALKENLDQIMSNLQDGIMLFTRDARAVLVSDSVQRFLGISRHHILGAEVHEIFDRNTVLGRTVREAFDARMTLVQEEFTTETGRRIQLSLDFILDDRLPEHRQSLGTLLTLHDLESVREIESELELSRRMAAIGRLTSGVGHEVKNPINAIVVHLELLRNKIDESDQRAVGHLEVIQSEIQRLDRVVQTLVDFSRPVELQLQEQDLRLIVSSVLALASADLETRDVQIDHELPAYPLMVKVDADLVKQALLNVVLNGGQAMSGGGLLEVRVTEEGRMAAISIRDHGDGIPEDVRPKIFDLYFTTKKEGSGIGLAMTYRILQLHNGQIDVESQLGMGTVFTLRLPLLSPSDPRLRGYLATATAVAKEPRA